ncbi:MAG: hypothetical protein EU549_03870 [Promethearchaeota archaeon]|nr:MAG: hypothetical protein EU549_03870 [Candidatus Lokiarchaeota archaeon]
MVKKIVYIIIFIISTIIALIHGIFLQPSWNIFLSWIFIGFWICITIKYIQMLKSYREFNSPHNTSSFILGTLFTGLLYSFIGFYTGLLQWNLIPFFGLYISLWILIFAIPYLIWNSYLVYSCFTKFSIVYFGNKSFHGWKYGIFVIILTFTIEIIFAVYFYAISNLFPILIPSIHVSPDFFLIIYSFFLSYVLIRHGILGKRRTISQITQTRRTTPDGRNIITTTATSTTNVQNPDGSTRRSSRRRSTTQTQRPSSSSSTSTSRRSKPTARRSTRSSTKQKPSIERKAKPKRKPRPKSRGISKSTFEKYKPKTAVLNKDDFKCIFCFRLPELPKDKGRGIILCPHCRYPAHADEFEEWMRDSHLCSRCDKPIRRKPKSISVKNYLRIYAYFLKMKKRKK